MSTNVSTQSNAELTPRQKLFAEKGYVVNPSLLPLAERTALLEASERTIAAARQDKWPHKVQLPAEGLSATRSDEIDCVERLLDPELGEPAFAKWYGSKEIMAVCSELLECTEGDLQLEYMNLNFNREKTRSEGVWHTDELPGRDMRNLPKRGAEEKRTNIKTYGIEWCTALSGTDTSLWVIPGSHQAELKFDKGMSRIPSGITGPEPAWMADATKVQLTTGDTVFFNTNLVHCKLTSNRRPSVSLHGYTGDARADGARLRNLAGKQQEEIDWMFSERMKESLVRIDSEEGFGVEDGPRMKMWKNLTGVTAISERLHEEAKANGGKVSI